jgi:hypothetical protein
MAELGIFEENEFTVVQPQQINETPPQGGDEPQDEPTDEIPLKDKEDIIKDLEKAKVGKPKDDSNDDQYNIEDGGDEGGEKPDEVGKPTDGGEKPDDEGGEKPTDGGKKPDDEGGEKPTDGGKKPTDGGKKGKYDPEKDAKDKERREKIKAKNAITVQIEEYQKVLEKHKEVLPNKVKNTLEKSIEDLTSIRNQIEIN